MMNFCWDFGPLVHKINPVTREPGSSGSTDFLVSLLGYLSFDKYPKKVSKIASLRFRCFSETEASPWMKGSLFCEISLAIFLAFDAISFAFVNLLTLRLVIVEQKNDSIE